jgi:hypothetical protein
MLPPSRTRGQGPRASGDCAARAPAGEVRPLLACWRHIPTTTPFHAAAPVGAQISRGGAAFAFSAPRPTSGGGRARRAPATPGRPRDNAAPVSRTERSEFLCSIPGSLFGSPLLASDAVGVLPRLRRAPNGLDGFAVLRRLGRAYGALLEPPRPPEGGHPPANPPHYPASPPLLSTAKGAARPSALRRPTDGRTVGMEAGFPLTREAPSGSLPPSCHVSEDGELACGHQGLTRRADRWASG